MLSKYAPLVLKGWEASAAVAGSNRSFFNFSGSSASSDAVPVGSQPDSPLLVRLPSRPFGASASLTAEVVKSVAGSQKPARLAVMRDSFSPSDVAQRPVSKLVRSLGNNTLAVNAELADPPSRVVVDEYRLDASSGSYKLHSVATDLLRYIRQAGARMALLPDVTAPGVAKHNGSIGASKGIRQSTNEVLMVAPTAFGFNDQAAQDNSFMQVAEKAGQNSPLTREVLKEFAGLHHQLTEVAGVKVHLFEHSLAHGTPDACFPNNWFSTHPAGEADGGVKQSTLVLYPMKAPNRAAERRPEVIDVLRSRGYNALYDMSVEEKGNKYFEGTGVLVVDRINGVAYVNISERADESLAQQWAERMGYKELVTFRSYDSRGSPVYHTNVMMAVGTGVAVVCGESVKDDKERKRLMDKLRSTHEVVDISLAQMAGMAGNVLEVEDGKGLPAMAMSSQAYHSFTRDQRKVLLRHCASLVHAPIDTLERVGGGSVRCTLAELF